MAALTPVLCARTGGGDIAAGLASSSASPGDTFPAGPNNFLRVKNTSGGAVTATVTPPTGGGPLGTTISPFALSPAVALTTGDRIYGPFPPQPFADPAGNVTVLCSTTGATVQVECLQMSAS
jgi:hypothetical protein